MADAVKEETKQEPEIVEDAAAAADENENAESKPDEENDAGEEDKEKKEEVKRNTVIIDWEKLTFEEMLQQKILLRDETESFMFSRGPKYSDEQFPVNCHICRQGNILTEEGFRNHVLSRRHQHKEHGRLLDPKFFQEPFYQSFSKEIEKETPIKIFPGETITELTGEYADRAIKKEDFEAKLPADEKIVKELEKDAMYDYNVKFPLIGLSYLYKMQGFKGVQYFCLLCNEKIKGEAFVHVVEPDHQAKYVIRHFPKLYEKVSTELILDENIDQQSCIGNIFRKLYKKIENVKGHKKMTIVDDSDFFTNRKRYLLKTRFDDHYDEDTVIITDKEVEALIRKCINGISFIKPDLISLENPKLGVRDGAELDGRGRSAQRLPAGNPEQRWLQYRNIIGEETVRLNQVYRRYDRYPKTHPNYEGEFNKYKSFKNDPKMRMGWNVYWTRRLRVLYENEIGRTKAKVKRTLGLRTDARTPSPLGRQGGGNFGPPNHPAAIRDMLAMNIQQQIERQQYGQQMMMQQEREEMMIQQQQQQQQQHQMMQQEQLRQQQQQQQQRQQQQRQQQQQQQQLAMQIPDEPLGVISVLRLMTALENQLGSLGQQAIKLLTRAVLAEKNNQNPNDLMMENDYYVFFVTAKEKLKGQLVAHFVDAGMIVGVKKAIADTETLIEMFEDYMRRNNKRIKTDTLDVSQSNQNRNSGGGNDYGSSSFQNRNAGNNSNDYDYASDQKVNNFSSGNNYSSGGGLGGNNYPSGSGTGSGNFAGGAGKSGGGGNNYSSGGGTGNYSSGGNFQNKNNYSGGGGAANKSGGNFATGNYSQGVGNKSNNSSFTSGIAGNKSGGNFASGNFPMQGGGGGNKTNNYSSGGGGSSFAGRSGGGSGNNASSNTYSSAYQTGGNNYKDFDDSQSFQNKLGGGGGGNSNNSNSWVQGKSGGGGGGGNNNSSSFANDYRSGANTMGGGNRGNQSNTAAKAYDPSFYTDSFSNMGMSSFKNQQGNNNKRPHNNYN